MFTPPFLLRLQPRCCARPDATPPLQPPALPAPTLPSKSVATATATAIAQPEQPQPQLSLSAHLGALAGVALATAAAVCSISRYRRSQRPQQQQQQQQQQLFKDQREEARANEQVFSADGRNGASLEIGAAIADGLVAQGEWWLQAEALFLLLLEEGGEQGKGGRSSKRERAVKCELRVWTRMVDGWVVCICACVIRWLLIRIRERHT